MIDNYTCSYCRREKHTGDVYYPVLDVDGSYQATCSIECANKIKLENIKNAEDILESVMKQNIEKDIW